ncbi:MAG: helix-turn-helix transcriptional regulator [Parcubacteria group bacterium]|nr:helix-turn-helix transcriptional regulator [Parcubacteria group bacterium]
MYTLDDLEKDLLKDKKYRKSVEAKRKDVAYRVARMLEEARAIKKITQKDLAKKIGTEQSAIARLERGKGMPNLKTLVKIAKALGTYLIPPKFALMKEIEDQYDVEVENLSTGLSCNATNYIKSFSAPDNKHTEDYVFENYNTNILYA